MKKLILFLAIGMLTFASCKKETLEPETPEPTPVATTSDYSVSIAAFDEAGFDNDLIVVFNSDTLGNLQDAEIPLVVDIETLYLAGNTISGELTTEVNLNDAVNLQLIDANGDVAMSYSGTMINDIYDGGQNHLSLSVSSSNVNASSLVGGLSFHSFEAVDMEFKYSMVFSIGN
jgi:hypothetical protein